MDISRIFGASPKNLLFYISGHLLHLVGHLLPSLGHLLHFIVQEMGERRTPPLNVSDAARQHSPQGEASEVGPSLVASGCDRTPHGSSAAVSARKINHNFKSLCCRGSDSSPARQRREARVECLKMRVVRPAEGLHTHARLAGARCQIVNAAASAAGRSINQLKRRRWKCTQKPRAN